MKPQFETFEIKKVSLIDGGGLNLTYSYQYKNGAITETVHRKNEERTAQQHPDLDEVMGALKEHILETTGHTTPMYKLKELYPGKKISDANIQKVRGLLTDKLKIKHVGWEGTNQLSGAKLTGILQTIGKQTVTLNSPRIVFASDKYGREGEVEELCKALKQEVYSYLWEEKIAQPEMAFTDPEEKPSKGEEPKAAKGKPVQAA